MLFPAFAKIQDDTEKLRVNFYKLLSVVGIINFPALLGLMVVSNNFVPLVFGEKWNSIIPVLQLLCVVGLLRSVGNPIGSLLMAKARVDISFKFNVFKTFLFIPAIVIGGQMAGAIGVTLGFLLVQIINTILSYFVMIKPVLGSSYRQYILSLWLPFYLSLPTLGVSYALGIVLKGQLALGMLLAVQIAAGVLAFRGDDCAVAPSAGGGSEASVLSQRKNENAFTGGVNGCFRLRQRKQQHNLTWHQIYEEKMKLLILGNHTCGNRGDSAILRGLLDAINILNPHAEVDVMSRYPVSSSWLLNRPVMGDPLFLQMKQHNSAAGVVGRVKKVLRRRYQHQVLLSRVTDTGKLRNIAIAQGFTDFVRLLSGYDAIIQVGGSFFVDLYGVPQFEHALCTFMAKKPLFMIGHSVGPFQDEQFNQLANYVFGHCDALILRESVSLDLMKRSNITTAKVEHGVDTAWLVDHHTEDFTASYAVQHWLDVAAQQKTVAITLRELAPFDKRLGTTQQAYEKAFAGVVNRILDEGYQVIALSTCTGIDSYNKDDRMVALNLRQHISDPARYHVVMDELNDLEMGKILGACELTVGTRLHSAIISMNFATPAIAINYEHKSAGIMQQLGLPEMAIDIRHLLDGSLQAMVADTLGQLSGAEHAT